MTNARFYKTLFTLTLLALVPSLLWAQCTPDPNSSGLYSPNEDTGIPAGKVGENYEVTITVDVPLDTVISGFTLDLDSVVLTDVDGLPPGFTYECSDANCSFPSGDKGCILMSGITNDPTHADDWPLTTTFVFYGKQSGISLSYPFTEELYTLTLAPPDPASVNDPNQDLRFSIGPNPVTKYSTLNFDLPTFGEVKIVIYNLVGSSVHSTTLDGQFGANTLKLDGIPLDAGIYFIELSQGNYNRSARFVIQE